MPPTLDSIDDVVLAACPLRRSLSLTDVVAASSKKPAKFPWETEDGSDGMWVMGPIGDMLLKKLRSRGTTSDFHPTRCQPCSPTSPSVKPRRRKCTAAGSRCQRYSPVVYVPTSLCDNFEIANDLKAAARKLLDDAAKDIAPGIREIVPGIAANDLHIDVHEPIPNGAPLFSDLNQSGHIVAFRIRQGRWQDEYRQAGVEGAKAVKTRLDRLEYACNTLLLPELAAWCDQYRSVKAGIAADKAYRAAEEKEMARQRKIKVLGPREGEVVLSAEEGEKAAAALGKAAAKEADEKIESAAELCNCGYHEVWHELGIDDRANMSSTGFCDLKGQLEADAEKLAVKGPLDVEPPPLLARPPSDRGSKPLISSSKQKGAVLSAGRLVLTKAPSLRNF